MRHLDLTIIYNESIESRIYLYFLKKNGYLPNKVIHIKLPKYKGRKYNIIKNVIGESLSSFLFSKIKKNKNSKINRRLANEFLNRYGLSYQDLEFNIETYTHEYLIFYANDINDNKLVKLLENEFCKTFLFTGGGILKKEILSIKDSKFIHIHPGVVPYVKGSNGIFWSYLIRGKSGYSCFYMNEGIDTGDILYTQEYEIDKFNKGIIEKYSIDEMYYHILKFYDPILRAITLIKLIDKSLIENKKLNQLDYKKQNPEEGRTYFRMHKTLLKFTIEKMRKEMGA